MLSPARAARRQLAALALYGWRSNPEVSAFPDDKPVIVFDGVCVLCSGFARFVARRDRQRQFRFVSAQSPLGQSLYRHAGLDAVNYETNLLIADGRFLGKMDAVAGIMARLGWPWRLVAAISWLPAPIADRLYDVIARNRYRIFGRSQACIRPDASWRDRVIE